MKPYSGLSLFDCAKSAGQSRANGSNIPTVLTYSHLRKSALFGPSCQLGFRRFVYIYIYIHTRIFVCLFAHMHVNMYAYAIAVVQVWVYVHMYVHVLVYVHFQSCECLYMC